MSNYIVDGSDLTSVANAIRAKSGGSSQLTFPAGFVSEIQSIQTGGSSSHTVTVSLGHPTHGSEFSGCILKDGGENGTQIGTIGSPTGSKTVTVTTGVLYVEVASEGGWVEFDYANLLAIGTPSSIGLSGYHDASSEAYAIFVVVGDGSIDLDFIDYDA